MAVALGLLTLIYLVSSWALLVLSHSSHLSWSQDNTCLLSILLISITDACIPSILRFLINVAGIWGAQVLNTSIFPTRAMGTSGFFLHQSLEHVNPWGWSFNPHTGTSLRYGDCISSLPCPATILDAVPFQMQSFSDRFVMGTVFAQESRGSTMVPQIPPNLCVCVLLLMTDYSLSLRIDHWVERREVNTSTSGILSLLSSFFCYFF